MSFDAVQYKSTTRQQWEDAAEAWYRWGPTLETWLAGSTERMLDAAGVASGSSVLDIAAGAGGQTLAAARRVGGEGRVVAIDISPTILTYAAKQAAEAGLTNVETMEADGEQLGGLAEASFDAAVSRLGLICLPDQAGALAGIHSALRPGGRLSAIVYSTADRNGFLLGSGVGDPPPSWATRAGAWVARAVQPRLPRRTRGEAGGSWLPRRRGGGRGLTAAAGVRSGVPAFRAGVLRGAPPDAVRRKPGAGAGGRLGGGRGRLEEVRDGGRLRRSLRAAGCAGSH